MTMQDSTTRFAHGVISSNIGSQGGTFGQQVATGCIYSTLALLTKLARTEDVGAFGFVA
jgi:hypothetical protein